MSVSRESKDSTPVRSAKVGARREGREAALQALCLMDLCGWLAHEVPHAVWSENPLQPRTRAFAVRLAEGVHREQEQIDALIIKIAENWEIKRMATVDRCVLRLATYELLFEKDTPDRVIINEALEIVKKYSTVESFKFVNGILDKIRLERPSHG